MPQLAAKTKPSLVRRRSRQTATQLLPLVYSELCALARERSSAPPLRGRFEPEALVHDAYVLLRTTGSSNDHEPCFAGRAHFYHEATRVIDQILDTEVRRLADLSSSALATRSDLEVAKKSQAEAVRHHDEILMVDEAITKLKRSDPTNARVITLRYFSGLTAEETAEILGVSVTTVERKWRYLRAWLRRELE